MDLSQIRQDIVGALDRILGEKSLTCCVCGGVRWLPPVLVTLPEVALKEGAAFEPELTGQMLPLAVFTCDVCGASVSINLIRLGLWQKWLTLSQLVLPGSSNGH